MPESSLEGYRREYERRVGALDEAGQKTYLPDAPAAKPTLNDLLISIRLQK